MTPLLSQLFNELFKNNANRSEVAEKRYNQNYFLEMTTVEGVYDYLMYVGKPNEPPPVIITSSSLWCSALNFVSLLRSSRLPRPRLVAPPVDDRTDPVQEHARSLH